jgi:ABC-type multidrug transport system fused ATPase/permease subunit
MSFWDTLRERLDQIGADIGNWVPKIIGAILILLIGLFIARIIRRIVKRILENDAVEGVLDKAGIGPALRNSGYSAASLGATLVYGLLAIIVLLLAATALEVQSLVDLLERLIGFIPVVFVAVILVVVAAAIGTFLADLARPWAQTHNNTWVPNAVRWGVIVFALLTAFDLVGIGQVSEDVRRAVLLAAGVAFAVAFGVGGIDTAKKWWAKYLSPRETSGL